VTSPASASRASTVPAPTTADIGIIGGSGFYSLLDNAQTVTVETPFGPPSDALTIGRLGDRSVAFLPRHGAGHRFAPHRVPYRANLWALRSVGVRQVVSLSAVGSLRADYGPGTLVSPDQVVDRTSGRDASYLSGDDGVTHIAFADPYCPRGRLAARSAAAHIARPLVDAATLVVINGPRFSTRAESLEYQSHGWSIIGMTGMPEALLARELALCYSVLALVTDLDAGVEAGSGVTHAAVLEQFAANLPKLRELLVATVDALPAGQDACPCGQVYSDTPASFELP
jgi:5'-methylthioadenosine phosphorylase